MTVHVFTYTFGVRDLFIVAMMWSSGFGVGWTLGRRAMRREAATR